MNKEIKEKWLKALRSKEYKQGYDYLRTGNVEYRYCYLGLLTNIYIEEKGLEWDEGEDGIYKFGGSSMCLSPLVEEWADLNDAEVCLKYRGVELGIVDINDDRDISSDLTLKIL
jgi:hypothetical protein